jgi:hypothetical protein
MQVRRFGGTRMRTPMGFGNRTVEGSGLGAGRGPRDDRIGELEAFLGQGS